MSIREHAKSIKELSIIKGKFFGSRETRCGVVFFFSSEATKEKEKEIAIEVRSQEVKITPVEEEEEEAEE